MEGGKGGRGVCVFGKGQGIFQDGVGWREDGQALASYKKYEISGNGVCTFGLTLYIRKVTPIHINLIFFQQSELALLVKSINTMNQISSFFSAT